MFTGSICTVACPTSEVGVISPISGKGGMSGLVPHGYDSVICTQSIAGLLEHPAGAVLTTWLQSGTRASQLMTALARVQAAVPRLVSATEALVAF
jgi:hypothetical protein